MAKVCFLLKKGGDDQKERLVNMFFQYGYKRADAKGKEQYKMVKVSTRLNIPTKYWIGRPTYRAKETKGFPEFPEFNARLDFLEGTIKKVYRRLVNDGNTNPPPELVKKEFMVEVGLQKPEDNGGVLTFIQKFIDENRHLRAENTIKKYEGTLNHLKKYVEKRGSYLDFASINMSFYADFHSYLVTELKLTDNSFGKYIATLRGFMRAAEQRGFKVSREFRTREFKVLKEDVDKIYLDDDELESLYNLDLSDNKSYEKVRDLFVLGCHVGLRFSDLSELSTKNIVVRDNVQYIKVNTKKTGQDVMFPIHPRVKEILNKYGSEFPKSISNQKTNDYLKEIGKLAELNDDVVVYKTKGGERKRFEFKKYDLITTHTARRSFATNAYKMNVPAIAIMKMTGHRTEASFLSYIRISTQENAQKMADHPFFNPQP